MEAATQKFYTSKNNILAFLKMLGCNFLPEDRTGTRLRLLSTNSKEVYPFPMWHHKGLEVLCHKCVLNTHCCVSEASEGWTSLISEESNWWHRITLYSWKIWMQWIQNDDARPPQARPMPGNTSLHCSMLSPQLKASETASWDMGHVTSGGLRSPRPHWQCAAVIWS